MVEEWNFNVVTDRLPNRDILKPKGYEKLTLLDTQDGKKIKEVDLVKHGLSPADLTLTKGKMKAKRLLKTPGRYGKHSLVLY